MNVEKRLLLGRLLTRSGDHAWDFALPLALLHAFPGRLQIAAIYFLLVKLLVLVLTPFCGRWIDRNSRSAVLRLGIGMQFVAVVFGGLVFWQLDLAEHMAPGTVAVTFWFALFLVSGVLASVGAMVTDISVGNDLAPSLVAPERLTWFNSWLRRLDLGTEVLSPILAGLLFAVQPESFHLAGFFLIVVWNVLSFFPEYWLLQTSLRRSSLAPRKIERAAEGSFWKSLFQFNFRAFLREPLSPLLISYALLWLSALSPHGVLLTGYLKDVAHLPESEIGLFRGLGALFGLVSTVSFPFLVRRLGLVRSSRWHLGFQSLTLALGTLAFFFSESASIYWFLLCVLLSRIGLYGFSNGEFELRQRLIPPESRGRLNAMSSFLTTLATLILFGIGSLLPKTEDFRVLVFVSFSMVIAGFVVFHFWSKRRSAEL